MALLAEEILKAYGIPLPAETDLTPLITFAIEQSVEICTGDFAKEIEKTINFVHKQLIKRGFSY